MSDESRDGFSKAKIQQSGVARERADEQPQSVLLIADGVQNVRHQEQPDEDADDVVAPAREQIDFEFVFHESVRLAEHTSGM